MSCPHNNGDPVMCGECSPRRLELALAERDDLRAQLAAEKERADRAEGQNKATQDGLNYLAWKYETMWKNDLGWHIAERIRRYLADPTKREPEDCRPGSLEPLRAAIKGAERDGEYSRAGYVEYLLRACESADPELARLREENAQLRAKVGRVESELSDSINWIDHGGDTAILTDVIAGALSDPKGAPGDG